MQIQRILIAVALGFNFIFMGAVEAGNNKFITPFPSSSVLIQKVACKRYKTCAAAVRAWCGGESSADRDRDLIPCENVCRTKAQVKKIARKIGCKKAG